MFKEGVLNQCYAMVVGCGALGNEVMKNLVLMGVRHLVIVDFDFVEQGNLSRSVLYRKKDVGEPKVEVARNALLDINPDLDIETIFGDIAYDVGLCTVRRMDIIIGCVDSRWARYCIQRLCLRVGKTWVDGGILNLEGTVRVFAPGKNCYACSLGDEGLKELKRRMPCSGIIRRQEQAGHAPTTPIIASIIGAIMVQEAIKVLGDRCWASADSNADNATHQHPSPITHHPKMFYYEGESLTVRTPIFEAWDEDCALHGEWQVGSASELPPVQRLRSWAIIAFGGSLLLNDPFVDYIINRRNDERYEVMLPAHKVEAFVTNHPQLRGCLLSDFYQHEYREIDESFPYKNLTLSDLGVPKNDIIRIRTAYGYKYVLTD